MAGFSKGKKGGRRRGKAFGVHAIHGSGEEPESKRQRRSRRYAQRVHAPQLGADPEGMTCDAEGAYGE